jgi:hypothetical protein
MRWRDGNKRVELLEKKSMQPVAITASGDMEKGERK